MVRVNYEKLKGESLIFPKDARDGSCMGGFMNMHANKGIIVSFCRTGLAKLTYHTHVFRSSAIDKCYWYRINAPHKIAFYNQVRGHGTCEA